MTGGLAGAVEKIGVVDLLGVEEGKRRESSRRIENLIPREKHFERKLREGYLNRDRPAELR